jgi:hypothetical protein
MTSSRRLLRLILGAAVFAAVLALAPAAEAARVYVSVAPPVPVVEVQPVAPGPHHVWVAGYHRWDGNAYVWVPGTWVVPPHHYTVWVPGHWTHNHHGHYWVAGHWRH